MDLAPWSSAGTVTQLGTLNTMTPPPYAALIMDFAGVLTDNLVDVYRLFEAREGLRQDVFLSDAWNTPTGKRLYEQLELGEITQEQWNVGMAPLIGVAPENLMGRLLQDLFPAYDMLRVAADARAAGMKTAVLSNSLGRAPHDPYAPYDLPGRFDAVVFSDRHGLRKPDPAIFKLTCELLGVEPSQCVFVDDIASNLVPAEGMGMAVLECLDEKVAAPQLRRLLQI